MADNLTQEGGDRYAAVAPILAAVRAAIAAAPDDEIRGAFGLGDWRVVTPGHRARYGEYFAPKVYGAMVDAMAGAVAGGRLAIRDFAVFEKGPAPVGELFPVTTWGPCIAAEMIEVDVTIAPGGDDYTGGGVSGVLVGDYGEWADGGVINHHYGDWIGLSNVPAGVTALTPPGLELAAARGRIRLMLDYGGLMQLEQTVVSALLVWGERVPGRLASNGAASSWDFMVVNGAPPIDGMVNAATWGDDNGYGPYQQVNWIGDRLWLGSLYSAAWVDQWIGSSAAGALPSSDVHALAWGEKTIPAAGWAGCFPRKKWIVRGESIGPGGQTVERYRPVEWIKREQWFARYGGRFDDWVELGAVVPAELVGGSEPARRIYAKFAPSFVEELNPELPGI